MIHLDKTKLKDELLGDKNLIDLYKSSRIIPFSQKNKKIVCCLGVISLFSSIGITSIELFEHIESLSSSLLGTIATITGFLIAGYTIFCSVMSPKLSLLLFALGKVEHNMSELKKTHLNLIRVFIYCLFFLILLILISAFSGTNNLFYIIVSNFFKNHETIFYLTNYITFNIIVIYSLFLIIQLGVFIFNIYHAIMTALVAYPELDKIDLDTSTKKHNPP